MNHLSPIVFDGESEGERCVLGSAKDYALGCVNFHPSGRVVLRNSVYVTMLAHLSEFAGRMHFVIFDESLLFEACVESQLLLVIVHIFLRDD